mmetsp:Transcript_1920/g.3637  ORF Transcript_1920/g.3637 Transcript_1920/m.3637 type:complete len:597 (-) Transcript_1920:34-1824(-)
MSHPVTVPFTPWYEWWTINPHLVSLAAGTVAAMSAEAVLLPLDCFKTRVQTREGFWRAGGLRGIYQGSGIALCGSVPASALFFCIYEPMLAFLVTRRCQYHEGELSTRYVGCIILAAVSGELAAACIRVPIDLVKQRKQTNALRATGSSSLSVFLASFQATAARDLMHCTLQYPLYECVKLGAASLLSTEELPVAAHSLSPAVAASCGSIAGVISAYLTAPFDLLKTRLNLTSGVAKGTRPIWLLSNEIRDIHTSRGLRGFFAGAHLRAAWMGLGGFVFLGSFELGKNYFAPKHQQQEKLVKLKISIENEDQLSFAAGVLAGMAVDVPLHPLDTLKTRLQSSEGFWHAGGFRGLSAGMSTVLVMSAPGSAVFFTVYDRMKRTLERQMPPGLRHDVEERHSGNLLTACRDAVSACVADISACSVRVPCEVVKQRMQTWRFKNSGPCLYDTLQSVSSEGARGFYAGFAATVQREVPFALIQMPLFEEIMRRHPWAQNAENHTKTTKGLMGMTSGAVAGACAGAVTTPLDVAKTRIMLTRLPSERHGLLQTMQKIYVTRGLSGLFLGVVPRTIHCCAGGALWLGAFEWAKKLFSPDSKG